MTKADLFWSSDKLTGIQTVGCARHVSVEFWSSDKLTGIQTSFSLVHHSQSFGAVTN